MGLVYRGHNDTYHFDNEAPIPGPNSDLLRFGILSFAPHVIGYNLSSSGSKVTYNVAGPLYSLIKEIALKGNLSLYFYDFEQNSENIKTAIFEGSFDVFGFPTYASMGSAFRIWSYQFAFPIPACLDIISLDHIIYRIEYLPEPLFVYSRVLDLGSWAAYISSVLVVAVVNHLLCPTRSFFGYVWFNSMSCFRPVSMWQKGKDRFLTAIYLLMFVIFMNTYGSQFFSNITMKRHPVLVDSLEDLVARDEIPVLAAATVLTEEEMDNVDEIERLKDDYFVKGSPYEVLKPRLSLYRQDKILFDDFRDEVYKNVSEGRTALLAVRCTSDYYVYYFKSGEYREKLHVSRSGGDWQPMFLSLMTLASDCKNLIQKTAVELSESGIYRLWSKDVVESIDQDQRAEVRSKEEPLDVSIFLGSFVVTAAMLFICLFVYGIELIVVGFNRSRPKKYEKRGRRHRYTTMLTYTVLRKEETFVC